MKTITIITTISLVFFNCIYNSCSSPQTVQNLPNLVEIIPGTLWRSGQPSTTGCQQLWNLGVRHIIKLNFLTEGSDLPCETLGITVDYIPLPPQDFGQIISEKPKLINIERAVCAMRIPNTNVHCLHGQDRTGIIVACYRIWIQGWSKNAAENEMLFRGYHIALIDLTTFWLTEVHERFLDCETFY